MLSNPFWSVTMNIFKKASQRASQCVTLSPWHILLENVWSTYAINNSVDPKVISDDVYYQKFKPLIHNMPLNEWKNAKFQKTLQAMVTLKGGTQLRSLPQFKNEVRKGIEPDTTWFLSSKGISLTIKGSRVVQATLGEFIWPLVANGDGDQSGTNSSDKGKGTKPSKPATSKKTSGGYGPGKRKSYYAE